MRKIIKPLAITAGILTAAQCIALLVYAWLSAYNVLVPQPTNLVFVIIGTFCTGAVLFCCVLWLNDN